MIRNFKALGLALIAVFALSAVAASAASASGELFHSSAKPTSIVAKSESNQVFVATATITCTGGEFTGTASESTQSSLTVHPVYTGCESSLGGNPSTVTTEGCNYIFQSEVPAGGHAKIEIECEAGKFITIDNSLCTIKIGSQTVGQGVTYTSINSKKEVTVNATATKIKIAEKTGSLCFLVGAEGTYAGTSIVKGFEDKSGGAQVSVWWE